MDHHSPLSGHGKPLPPASHALLYIGYISDDDWGLQRKKNIPSADTRSTMAIVHTVVISQKFKYVKNKDLEPEKLLGGLWHWLSFQRTWVQFPAPTW